VSAGYIASYYNVPIYPESCTDSTMDNKTTFSTMVRIAGSWQAYGASFVRLFQLYGWYRFIILTDSSPAGCVFGATSLVNQLAGSNTTIAEWIKMSTVPIDSEIADYVSRVQQRARSKDTLCIVYLYIWGPIHKRNFKFYLKIIVTFL